MSTYYKVIFYKDPAGSKPTHFLTWGKQHKLYNEISQLKSHITYDNILVNGETREGYKLTSKQVVINVHNHIGRFPYLIVYSMGKNKNIPVRYENNGILALAVFKLLKRRFNQTNKR